MKQKMNIRERDVMVCQKDGQYLVAKGMGGLMKWSMNIYDGLRIRNREDAERLAKKTGAELLVFNPLSGERRPYVAKDVA